MKLWERSANEPLMKFRTPQRRGGRELRGRRHRSIRSVLLRMLGTNAATVEAVGGVYSEELKDFIKLTSRPAHEIWAAVGESGPVGSPRLFQYHPKKVTG